MKPMTPGEELAAEMMRKDVEHAYRKRVREVDVMPTETKDQHMKTKSPAPDRIYVVRDRTGYPVVCLTRAEARRLRRGYMTGLHEPHTPSIHVYRLADK